MATCALFAATGVACSGREPFTSLQPDASGVVVVAPEDDSGSPRADMSSPIDASLANGTDASAIDPAEAASEPSNGVDASGVSAVADAAPDAPPLLCTSAQLACGGICVAEDSNNCGACGKSCTAQAHAVANCTASAGQYACAPKCVDGYSSCPSAGCVDLQNDKNNCGRCGHSCLGGMCSAGACGPWQVTAVTPDTEFVVAPWTGSGLSAPLATDGKSVVWINSTKGVLEAPLTGGSGAPITLYSAAVNTSLYAWGRVAIANGTVAWTLRDDNLPIAVWTSPDRVPLGGTRVAEVPSSEGHTATGLAFDLTGSAAYLMDVGDPNGGGTARLGLYRCLLTGGLEMCSPEQPTGAPPDWGLANDVAISTSGVFFTDTSSNSVNENASAVVKGQNGPCLLAVDTTNVYWANVSDGSAPTFSILKTSQTTSGTPAPVVGTQSGILWGMATDGVYLYFSGEAGTTSQGGDLKYVRVSGGTPSVLVPGQQVVAVAVGGGAIVWIDAKSNTISAIAAPPAP